mmetsp:Transcript_23543/g.30632  ORF Transcript_23543/g.30632 Transcript_23543/m.30632 type:complete len:97 (-) Transcript_23543:89-379(-)
MIPLYKDFLNHVVNDNNNDYDPDCKHISKGYLIHGLQESNNIISSLSNKDYRKQPSLLMSLRVIMFKEDAFFQSQKNIILKLNKQPIFFFIPPSLS